MKAEQLRQQQPVGQKPLNEVDLPVPQVGERQVLIRVHSCGVCHTDLHIVEGDIPPHKMPVVPGHQIVGTVEQAGRGVTRHKVGDRVGVGWLNWSCGECEYCMMGLENLCDNALFTGYDVDGGYGQYQVTGERFAYRIPVGFSDDQAAPLLCAGVVGYRALRLAERGVLDAVSDEGRKTKDESPQLESSPSSFVVRPSSHPHSALHRLGIYGFGASAHVTMQVARYWGAQIYVFTRSPEHRKLAEELGAVWTGGAEEDPGAQMDASIIFAPSGGLVPPALARLRKAGVLVLAGIHMSPIPQFDYDLIWGERMMRSVANATRRDAEELLALAAEIPIRSEVETFPLGEANEVLAKVKASQIRGAASLKVDA